MGHVHLRVAAIAETVAFYRDVLGFGLMAELGRQAAFLSAGGYHHHLGANTWESAGAGPAAGGNRGAAPRDDRPAGRRRRDRVLAQRRSAVPDTPQRPLIRDPSGNALVLQTSQLTPVGSVLHIICALPRPPLLLVVACSRLP